MFIPIEEYTMQLFIGTKQVKSQANNRADKESVGVLVPSTELQFTFTIEQAEYLKAWIPALAAGSTQEGIDLCKAIVSELAYVLDNAK